MANINGLLFCLLVCTALTTAADLECPEIDEDVILYPNPANCSTFYQCYNGSVVEKNCPDGLIYNPELLVCDWPWAYECVETPQARDFNPDGNVELITVPPPVCPPPGSEINATLFVNVYNCSTYYTCESGELTTRNCPPGLHFNPLIGVCDFPQAANCKEIIPAVPAKLTILVPSKPFSSKLDPACNPDGPPTCPPPPGVGNVTVCPNPYNCSNYYYCDNGEAKIRDCPPGLEYNAELGVCDYDWAANCEELPSNLAVKAAQKVQRLSKLPVRVIDPACNPDGPPTCPPPPNAGNVTLCPNPYNCSNYYYCDNGEYFIRDCPTGLEYNAELGVCDYDWAANCEELKSEISFEPKRERSWLKLELPEVVPVINDACSPTGPPNCPPPGTLGNVTNCPNPYNCSNYYYCDNGVAKLRDCPPGLEYNSLAETCDYTWAANCVALPSTVQFEDKMTLDSVKVMLKNVRHLEKLPEVVPVINDACSPTGPPNCPPPGTVGNVTNCPNPYNCSNYYYCDNGEAKMRDCPPNLEYNSVVEACDFAWAANCVAIPSAVQFEDKMALASLKVMLKNKARVHHSHHNNRRFKSHRGSNQ